MGELPEGPRVSGRPPADEPAADHGNPEDRQPAAAKDHGYGVFHATGGYHDSIAQVLIRPGSGKVTVNGLDQSAYFSEPDHLGRIAAAHDVAGRLGNHDVVALVKGGSSEEQAHAVCNGIALALSGVQPHLVASGGLEGPAEKRDPVFIADPFIIPSGYFNWPGVRPVIVTDPFVPVVNPADPSVIAKLWEPTPDHAVEPAGVDDASAIEGPALADKPSDAEPTKPESAGTEAARQADQRSRKTGTDAVALLDAAFEDRLQDVGPDGLPWAEAARLLGIDTAVGTAEDADALIRAGLPVASLDRLSDVGVPADAVDALLPRRTRNHRKQQGGGNALLTVEESDRTMRVAVLVCAARMALADSDVDAIAWLSRGKTVLAGRSPLEAARTSIGFDQAINLAQALAWDMVP